jgi:hypothetical protein
MMVPHQLYKASQTQDETSIWPTRVKEESVMILKFLKTALHKLLHGKKRGKPYQYGKDNLAETTKRFQNLDNVFARRFV